MKDRCGRVRFHEFGRLVAIKIVLVGGFGTTMRIQTRFSIELRRISRIGEVYVFANELGGAGRRKDDGTGGGMVTMGGRADLVGGGIGRDGMTGEVEVDHEWGWTGGGLDELGGEMGSSRGLILLVCTIV